MKVLSFSLGALRTNTYFCFDESGTCVVIDPGMDAEGIWEKLVQKGLNPTYIFLTHGHFDHSQAAKALADRTGATVCIHKEDAVMLEDPRYNSANLYYRGDTVFYPRMKNYRVLEDGEILNVGSMSFQVLHTPGHTPGSVCFMTEDALFCGDTVFAYGYGRYDLWGGDRSALARSLDRISELEGDQKLCPGHGNTATLSRIRDDIRMFSASLR